MHTDMEDGSKDAVTGLAAFDDLDPISAVSALSLMPELEPPPAPSRPTMRPSVRGGRSLPPQPPPTASRSPGSLLPPTMRSSSGSVPAPGVRSVPPPPPTAGLRSVPPPPPTASRPAGARSLPPPPPAQARSTGDMEMYDEPDAAQQDFDQIAPTQSFARPADVEPAQFAAAPAPRQPAGASRRGPVDDTGLLELSATTVATDIDMDWDDEEMVTKMRDEAPEVNLRLGRSLPYDEVAPQMSSTALSAGPALISVGGRPSPFPPPIQGANLSPYAVSVPPPGRLPSGMPSPFEEDGATRVRPRSSISSAPQPVLRAFTTLPPQPAQAEVLEWPEARPSRKPLLIVAGVIAAGLLFVAARALFGAPETGTVTLAATPLDATVEVDGRPLTGQTSPFSLQGLTPGIDHELRVSSPGYEPQTLHFALEPGEVKGLPEVALAELPSGFAIDSVPGGAHIVVDGQVLEPVTPARVIDVAAGLHTLRLEQEGYAAWETQVIVSEHEVMALPTATLVRVEAAPAVAEAAAAPAAAEPTKVAAAQTSPRKVSAREQRKARRAARRAAKQPSVKPAARQAAAPRPRAPAPVAAASGKGVLRINSRPWSQVFVDGRPAGNTPQMSLQLAPGKHEIKLVNKPMGMQKKLSVTIAAGKTTTKIVNLID